MQNDLNNINLKPFLRWAGGKTWVKKSINDIIQKEFQLSKINNYHEPFLGAGAIFFHLKPKKAFISDLNNELINAYSIIKDDIEDLFDELKIHEQNHSEMYYYEIRSWDRTEDFYKITNVKRAARFLYLNKSCWNGLYRVNSKGYFNVPIGFSKKTNIIFDFDHLRSISAFLNEINLKMESCSFEDVLKRVKKNDLVYFDPPYYKEEKSKAFTKYTKNDFTIKEHEKLKEVCDKIVQKGAYVIISNSDTPFIKDLYLKGDIKYKYIVHELKAPRNINSDINKREKVKELLIYNSKK